MTESPGTALGYVPPEALPSVQPPQPVHLPHPPEPGAMHAADALRSAGIRVTLASGERAAVRFSFLSLYWIEQEYGSLKALLDVAERLQSDDAAAQPMMGIVLDLMRFSLTPDTEDQPLPRAKTARMLDLQRLGEYLNAAVRAINEAFGPAAPPDKDAQERGPVDPTPASTGSSGGPSPSVGASPTGSGA